MKEVCIVIPVYSEFLNEYEKISLKRILKVFENRDIAIVCPFKLNTKIISEFSCSKKVSYVEFPDLYFKNLRGYNQLLKNDSFYLKFIEYKYILLCQLDVLVISDNLNSWLAGNYDNIGAPIFEGYTKPNNVINIGNNGGFCLRNVHSCITVLQNKRIQPKFSTLWQLEKNIFLKSFRILRDGIIYNQKFGIFKSRINEDIFWSVIVPSKYSWFKNCDSQKSMFFAYDANPRLLYELCNYQLPIAIHAWWKYDVKFINEINEQFDLF